MLPIDIANVIIMTEQHLATRNINYTESRMGPSLIIAFRNGLPHAHEFLQQMPVYHTFQENNECQFNMILLCYLLTQWWRQIDQDLARLMLINYCFFSLSILTKFKWSSLKLNIFSPTLQKPHQDWNETNLELPLLHRITGIWPCNEHLTIPIFES